PRLQPEQPLRVRGARGREYLRLDTEQRRGAPRDMRQERGLVAAIPRRRFEIARQQIRRVGLEQHAVERHLGERIAERVPAPLVAEPAGDADIKPEVEIAAELDPAAGEAVRDAADDPADERLEQRDEALVR